MAKANKTTVTQEITVTLNNDKIQSLLIDAIASELEYGELVDGIKGHPSIKEWAVGLIKQDEKISSEVIKDLRKFFTSPVNKDSILDKVEEDSKYKKAINSLVKEATEEAIKILEDKDSKEYKKLKEDLVKSAVLHAMERISNV